ncbi:MAG: aspartate aminotransferase family protein [Deltaproteobacteria bacterium]|nr:MAG: aspartate aminotransferase family protein [Deltaproteobacteria bacterium]
MKIPKNGQDKEQLFKTMEGFRADDVDWRSGRTWGYVYNAGREAEEVAKQAYTMFLSENALDPTVYPSLLRFENEVVGMVKAHLEADEGVVGNFTSGGTESIMLAVKAARDSFRARRPEIKEPEMILPVTAHAAFQKAGHYLDVKPVLVPVSDQTFKADVAAMEQAITANTILLVGSAPSYAHGVVDPIEQLGQLALGHDLLLHVDACIGGFLLPYFRRLGAPVPDFDFRVPGVTSLSLDLHKYAYCAKGASLVLYRDRELRKHQVFACARWTGYSVVNSTVQSSKSGGPMAAAWAVLNFIGDDGYLEHARGLYEATQKLVAGIDASEDLQMLGHPEMSLMAFSSDTVNVFHVADEMAQRGWYVQPQLGFGGSKPNIHLSVAPSNVPWVEDLLADLAKSVAAAKQLPPSDLAATVAATFANLDPAGLTPEIFSQMLGMAGMTSVALPDRMADINEVLDALPAEVTETLLSTFINELFVPPKD